MAHENGNGYGLTKQQWSQVLQRAGWLRFLLHIVAAAISFAAIGGIYATTMDHRIEKNASHLNRVDTELSEHGRNIASMQASQAATETAAARLEERLTAQGRTLSRIEGLLETLLEESYERGSRRPRDFPRSEE